MSESIHEKAAVHRPGADAPRTNPKPGWVAAAITVMAVVVAVMVDRLGVVAAVDRMIEERVGGIGLDGDLVRLSPWLPWFWLVAMAGAISYQILHVAGHSRRVMLGVTLLVLHVSWIPVLALCSRVVPLASTGIGLAWAVICSLIYAARHREVGGH